MKTAFLFPGQGAQTPGMGADLYNYSDIYRQTFDLCEAGSGMDLKTACFEGQGMDGSETIQSAIFAHTVSLLKAIQAKGIRADVYAGLSLGEYSALCAAGVLEPAQGAALVRRRGAIMDNACPPGEGGMLSVIGFTMEQVEASVAGYPEVYLANHLSEQQLVLGGHINDLLKLKDDLEAAGAKMVTLLAVKGPSHCPLLSEAAKQFAAELEGTELGPMNGTVYSNALGAPYPPDTDIRALLCEQMRARVRWHDSVEHMLANGVTRFVEIGPGNVLAKLLKRRAGKDASVLSVRDVNTLEAFLRECGEEDR
jgi:[acyl-carrier-protein] S-malonyltransferase